MLYLLLAPDPPTDVQISSSGTTTATFMWQAPVVNSQNQLNVIISYVVLLTQEQLNISERIVNITSTSYSFTSLEEFTTYSCQVAAVSGKGVGMFSSLVNFTTEEAGKLITK